MRLHSASFVLLLIIAMRAEAQTGGDLNLTWYALTCGGGISVAGTTTLQGSIAQPEAGAMAAGDLELRGGFLGVPVPELCYPDCEGDDDLDIFDYLCFLNLYGLQGSYADCESDGDWDVFDFLCFQAMYAAGCP